MNFRICKIILMALSCLFIMVGCGVKESKPAFDSQPELKSIENEIISCSIIFNRDKEIEITVKPIKQSNGSNSYSCQISCPAYFVNKPLSSNAGEFIIRSCDSLFVKKTIPAITKDQCKGYHATADPEISFHIFTTKGWIHKNFRYALDQDEYSYHYSECFTNLCDMITEKCSDFLYEMRKENGIL